MFSQYLHWRALKEWTGVFDEKHPAKTMIIIFPDIVAITKQNFEGLVINPFGPKSIYMPKQLIDGIVNMEGYQDEYVKHTDSKVNEIKVEKDTKIMLGVPKETNEVKLIKENLALYGTKNKSVNTIDLLLKIEEESKEQTYLCVVDCKQDNAHEIFDEIYNAVGGYAQEIKIIDFVVYSVATFTHGGVSDKSMVYLKQ